MTSSCCKSIQPVCRYLLLCVGAFYSLAGMCGASAAEGAGPLIAIDIPGQRFALKSPIKFKLSAKNIPHGYSFALFLRHDFHEKEGRTPDGWSPGCAGPLSSVTVPVSGNGPMLFDWDGSSTWSAPVDAPERCTKIMPGLYKIQVALYKSQGLPLVGRLVSAPVKTFLSHSFYLEGKMDLSDLKRRFEYALIGYLFTSNKLPETRMKWEHLLKTTKDIYERRDGVYCLEQHAALPFAGKIEACTKVPVYSEEGLRYPVGVDFIEVKGDVTAAMGGVLTVHQAVRYAGKAALAPYLTRFGLGRAQEKDPAFGRKKCEADKWCRGSRYFATDSLTLRISVSSWKYIAKFSRWNVHLSLTAIRNNEVVEDRAILVCVGNAGFAKTESDLPRRAVAAGEVAGKYLSTGYACSKP